MQPTPPAYHLEAMKVPVVTYSGGQDILADTLDVQWLLEQLTSLQKSMNFSTWNHLDFIWGVDAPIFCYYDIINWIFQ